MLSLRRVLSALFAVVAASAALSQPSFTPAQPAQTAGPRTIPAEEKARTIPGRFVVTLRERIDPRTLAREYGIEPDFVYTHVLTGFAGSISEAAPSQLMADRRVARVEPDRPVFATQTGSWGLDRIDQRQLPLDGQFNVQGTGLGVSAYIVDTGIRFDHDEFGGRAVQGVDVIGDGRNGSDCNGHGTHVAGTVGGRTYGVAREVSLVSARVLDCNGSGLMSGVIEALDWIAKNGQRPGVVNMSLGGAAHSSVDDAVSQLVAAGFTAVAAAGNESADACLYSPARVPEAITIAATDSADVRPSWSNYGSCVDLFAPGVSITSAWHTTKTATATLSGTSMASPHVAGAAALILQETPGLSPADVAASISESATKNIVSGAASANNHLLFVAPPATATEGVTINGTSGDDVVNANTTVPGQPFPTAEADVIHGLAGNDTLSGVAGNDTINGGDGTDVLISGPGDDVLDGGAGLDTAAYPGAATGVMVNLGRTSAQQTYGAGTDTLVNIERVNGSAYADVIVGNSGSNRLAGAGGNDILNGAAGNDGLLGGQGQDQFRFNTALDPAANVDTLPDFSAADDTVQLSRSIFTAFGSTGTLASSAFRTGTAAQDSDDRIIYDSATGRIYYDPDGTGSAAQVLFARVPAGTALTNADFTVIN